MRLVHMTRGTPKGSTRCTRAPFFHDLVTFMSSGPSVVLALEAPNAIAKWREVIGATDPAKAAEGTVRKRFATDIGEERRPRLGRAVHGGPGDRVLVRSQELLAID